ncbi:MAG: DUF2818 family protein [Comamonas sp.]|uniref:DUF2818 family protein n=1 Tax=Comamonas sp. TaxID=34028 RepID=UPI00281C7D81|nr:DUF2818 family protein [Comamonas sp.]MDR0215782.1 DUF2818 family protein [Comamonas sp.]MDR2299525.1 DUF2818 family protein [Comamonas sp.]
MSITASIWLIILAALVAANLPFINQRLGIVGPVVQGRKPLWVRLLEMIVLYLLVGGLGLVLERRAGQVYPQGWEFYAVTATLFLTLAFPGFVYRYLVHRKG